MATRKTYNSIDTKDTLLLVEREDGNFGMCNIPEYLFDILYEYSLIYRELAATPPSGRLFLLVPAESFFGPWALIIKF